MIKISVYYPNKEGKKFDVAYYRDKHMPLVKKLLSPMGLRGAGIEKGLAGGAPGAPAPNICVGHLLFDTVDAFLAAFGKHGKEIMADVPNYTNVDPVVQVGEIVM